MDHYFSEKPGSRLKLREFKVKIKGIFFSFYLGSGVFSSRKVDKGTFILAETMVLKKSWRVLDLGCGNGVLGVVAGKFVSDVVLVDVNRRACSIAEKNLELNGVSGDVFIGDLYGPVSGKFDSIICNPPISVGRKVCFKIIEGAKGYLVEKGLLQIVAKHNKGGKVLMEKMEEVFGNVKVLAKKSGYWVYVSER